jgi:hypothetical protein
VAGVTLRSDRLRQLTLAGAVVLCRQWPSCQPGLADRGWLVDLRRLRGALILSIRCRLQRHHPIKHHLLEKAWINFTKTGSKELRVAFEKFCHEQAHWMEDYALFRALKIRYNGAYYLEWPRELVQRVPKALAQARNDLVNQIDQVCFVQFLLFRQGERLQKHARAKGLRLIGDLPFFVSPDSSDVWANPELFLLDDERRPRFRAGAFHLIILAHRDSSGVTRFTIGRPYGELAIAGASIVCALCSCTLM